jgi:hypothetical protein
MKKQRTWSSFLQDSIRSAAGRTDAARLSDGDVRSVLTDLVDAKAEEAMAALDW